MTCDRLKDKGSTASCPDEDARGELVFGSEVDGFAVLSLARSFVDVSLVDESFSLVSDDLDGISLESLSKTVDRRGVGRSSTFCRLEQATKTKENNI